MESKTMKKRNYVYLITIVAAIGGFLFGFDTAVISGANPFIKTYFSLSEIGLGWAVGSLVLGCMVGAAISGKLSDRYGRKRMLITTSIIFAISAIGSALATAFWFFVLSRIICGTAVGAASLLSPTYIAEISPSHIRGRLVSLNQLAITIGILVVYFTNYLLVSAGEHNWRYMLGSEVIPAFIFFALLFLVPESPRWLVKNNQRDKALKTLTDIGGDDHAMDQLKEIDKTLKEKVKVSLGVLFKGPMAKIMVLGILLAAFQQITGINAIIYFAPTIFAKTGIATSSAFLQSVIVGVVNVAFTFVAIGLIDKAGRKPLMLFGSAGMAISLTVLVGAFALNRLHGFIVLLSVLGYIASFAASLAPVMWVVTSEIYPNKYRGTAMSISTAVSWMCTYLVVQTFPWMLNQMGGAIAFGVFAVLSVITFIFILIYIPETKGKSLEEIEKELGLSTEEAQKIMA